MKFCIITFVTAVNLVLAAVACADETHLGIMSVNAWGGRQNAEKSSAETIVAIQAAQADVIGLQEASAESVPCRSDYCPPQGPSIATDQPQDHRNRIDFIFVLGESVVVNEAAVVGESSAVADIVVRPWPSDHRAVVARITSGQIN